jgi:hypothetical protein
MARMPYSNMGMRLNWFGSCTNDLGDVAAVRQHLVLRLEVLCGVRRKLAFILRNAAVKAAPFSSACISPSSRFTSARPRL